MGRRSSRTRLVVNSPTVTSAGIPRARRRICPVESSTRRSRVALALTLTPPFREWEQRNRGVLAACGFADVRRVVGGSPDPPTRPTAGLLGVFCRPSGNRVGGSGDPPPTAVKRQVMAGQLGREQRAGLAGQEATGGRDAQQRVGELCLQVGLPHPLDHADLIVVALA